MAPSTSPPRHQTPSVGQAPRNGVQAGRVREVRLRTKQAARALQFQLKELAALEDDEATIKAKLIAEIELLKKDLGLEKVMNKDLRHEAKRTCDRWATQVKQLEQELVEAKAKIAVHNETRHELADAHIVIMALEQELEEEKARCSANCDAKRELDELKAKLVEMGAGAKVKSG